MSYVTYIKTEKREKLIIIVVIALEPSIAV